MLNLAVLQSNLRYFGLRASLKHYSIRAVNRVMYFTSWRVIIVPSHSVVNKPVVLPPRTTGRFLTAEELLRFANDPDLDLLPAEINKAFNKGDSCFGLLRNDTLVSYAFYAHTPTGLFGDDVALSFDPAWAYVYKAHTHPKCRGEQLHALGKALAMQHFAQRGFSGAISVVLINNFASLRTARRMAGMSVGRVHIARVLGRYAILHSGDCAAYGLRVRSIRGGEINNAGRQALVKAARS